MTHSETKFDQAQAGAVTPLLSVGCGGGSLPLPPPPPPMLPPLRIPDELNEDAPARPQGKPIYIMLVMHQPAEAVARPC